MERYKRVLKRNCSNKKKNTVSKLSNSYDSRVLERGCLYDLDIDLDIFFSFVETIRESINHKISSEINIICSCKLTLTYSYSSIKWFLFQLTDLCLIFHKLHKFRSIDLSLTTISLPFYRAIINNFPLYSYRYCSSYIIAITRSLQLIKNYQIKSRVLDKFSNLIRLIRTRF